MKEAAGVLMDFVERQAALHPDHTAVISGTGVTSYSELVSCVRNASASLIDRGVAEETRVAVCADRSLAWIVGTLGILSAGGVYIPVDPTTPLQRMIKILRDASVQMLLTDPGMTMMSSDSIEVVTIDTIVETATPATRRPQIRAGQAAYGIYTSGSTDLPKSVIVSHDSLGHYAAVLRRELMLTATDLYLHTASSAFSASLRQLVAPLVSGSTVVIAARDEIRDPARLISRMIETGVTVFDSIPSYLVRWLATVSESPCGWRERLAASLRLIFTTGEALSTKTVKSLHVAFPEARIFNLYGQTETTGTVSMHEANSNEPDPIPIGRAFDPCRFYVLNEQMEPASDGELYVSGPCLALGYPGRPDITGSRFLPDPFARVPGARMYRTGDHVHYLSSGLLQFKGRTDNQVKIHGVKIDLDEVDANLMAHPDVQETATVLRPVAEHDLRLVAFVVSESSRHYCDAGELQSFLATRLPGALIPGIIMFIDELPRTISGKIDRPALMTRELSLIAPEISSIEPRTEIERLIVKCWEDILHVKGISIEDDFFALGGDSILAIEMFLHLQKMLSVQLSLGTLFFQDPTLKVFADAIVVELKANIY